MPARADCQSLLSTVHATCSAIEPRCACTSGCLSQWLRICEIVIPARTELMNCGSIQAPSSKNRSLSSSMSNVCQRFLGRRLYSPCGSMHAPSSKYGSIFHVERTVKISFASVFWEPSPQTRHAQPSRKYEMPLSSKITVKSTKADCARLFKGTVETKSQTRLPPKCEAGC